MTTSQPTDAEIREFVIAGHGNLVKVRALLDAHPALLNLAYEWRPGDTETALQGAAHVGNRAIAEYLLAQGAPLDICTAAMLGNRAAITQFLHDDAGAIRRTGAHGISLLCHAALSGDVDLVAELVGLGATSGSSMALSLAVSRSDLAMTRWLLTHSDPDLTWKNFQEKQVLAIALENGQPEIAALLKEYGAPA